MCMYEAHHRMRQLHNASCDSAKPITYLLYVFSIATLLKMGLLLFVVPILQQRQGNNLEALKQDKVLLLHKTVL